MALNDPVSGTPLPRSLEPGTNAKPSVPMTPDVTASAKLRSNPAPITTPIWLRLMPSLSGLQMMFQPGFSETVWATPCSVRPFTRIVWLLCMRRNSPWPLLARLKFGKRSYAAVVGFHLAARVCDSAVPKSDGIELLKISPSWPIIWIPAVTGIAISDSLLTWRLSARPPGPLFTHRELTTEMFPDEFRST